MQARTNAIVFMATISLTVDDDDNDGGGGGGGGIMIIVSNTNQIWLSTKLSSRYFA